MMLPKDSLVRAISRSLNPSRQAGRRLTNVVVDV
jgi:hypothetical protein